MKKQMLQYDTRPPMLIEMTTIHRKIRIHWYSRRHNPGKAEMEIYSEGPNTSPYEPTEPRPTYSEVVPGPRKKLDSKFSEEKTNLRWLDTLELEIILIQGLPRHFSTTAIKQAQQRRFGIMWRCSCKDQVGLFNKGREDLFDEYGDAFVLLETNQFMTTLCVSTSLVNDMKILSSTFQLNR
ncbi:hypothetical protein Tco_0150443 [Tanacetum coccineum]